jgi:F0F1-type ATP synthase membrane subunit c/vacuolar-type H+-ATPase subunit K
MTVVARVRFAVVAVLLSVVYYYLLIYIVGWMSAQRLPGWWIKAFPSSNVGLRIWAVAEHSVAVLSAALPVGVAAVLCSRQNAVQLGLIAGSIATVAAVAPSLTATIWPLIWNHPVFFVTDQIKLIGAVPFVAWVLRSASSNNRFERSRVASSMSEGRSR